MHFVDTGPASVCTSLSPMVSSRSSRMVLKCSSHTCRVFSRINFSNSHSAAFRSSTRSLWLDNSLSSSATSSDWSRLLSVKWQFKRRKHKSHQEIWSLCDVQFVVLLKNVCIPSVRCSESSRLVSLRLCLKGESEKYSLAPRGLEDSRGVLRSEVLLSRAILPLSTVSETLPSVPLPPCNKTMEWKFIIKKAQLLRWNTHLKTSTPDSLNQEHTQKTKAAESRSLN